MKKLSLLVISTLNNEDVGGFAVGTYTVIIQTDEKTINRKLIVQ